MTTAQADLHFHALHGVDDGPATLDDSLALLRAAERDGTTTVTATPHLRGDFLTDVGELHERVAELRAAAFAAGLSVELSAGAELGHDMVGRLTSRELESVAQGRPGARWLLVETPFEGIGPDFHAATDELRDRGFGIVIAHPERSADAALNGCAGLFAELGRGALAQVNGQSITGEHGPEVRAVAFRLIAAGHVTIVGSDAHGPTRPPLLARARRVLADGGFDAAVGHELTVTGPLALLTHGIVGADLLVA